MLFSVTCVTESAENVRSRYPREKLYELVLRNMNQKLNSSVLGTKCYWDDVYKGEIKNYKFFLDFGEEWFGESFCKRIVQWVTQNIPEDDNIIDIGCGNGKLLYDLSLKGFKALSGIDYSENAIELANLIAKNSGRNVSFSVCNILEESFQPIYNLALDKGTYDAVSLDPDNAEIKRAKYVQAVWNLLKENGLFLIASCNWTGDELKNQFSSYFTYIKTLPGPSFVFGGQTGSTVTTAVFKKNL